MYGVVVNKPTLSWIKSLLKWFEDKSKNRSETETEIVDLIKELDTIGCIILLYVFFFL